MSAVTDILKIESEKGKWVEPNFDENKIEKENFSVCNFQGVINARGREWWVNGMEKKFLKG